MKNKKKNIRKVNRISKVDGSSLKRREVNEKTRTEIENPTTNQIVEELKRGTCTVFFYKIYDGSFRKMKCTLAEETPVPTKYNRQGVIVVWDLDASQWRSFYPNRVFRIIRDEETDVQ